MSSVNEEICTLKNKITFRSVKSIFSEHDVKNTMFCLKEDFLIVPIDMVPNNVLSSVNILCLNCYKRTKS